MALNPTLTLFYNFATSQSLEPLFGLGPTLTGAGGPTFGVNGLILDGSDDTATTTDISWFEQSQGVWYLEASIANRLGADGSFLEIDDGSLAERHAMEFRNVTDSGQCAIVDNSSSVFAPFDPNGAWTNDQLVRIAFYYDATDARAAFDGTLSTLDSSLSLPSGLTTFRVGSRPGGNFLAGTIKEIRYYNEKDGGTGDVNQFIQDLTNGLVFENADVWGAQNSFHIPFYRKQRR